VALVSHKSRDIHKTSVVAWTPALLIPIAACLLKVVINAAQIQR